MKKIIALLATALFVISAASAAVPVIEKVELEAPDLVEVEFVTDVQYENVSVNVTSETGEALIAEIVKKDDDDLTFRVQDAAPATAYSFEISGIRAFGDGNFETVSGSFKTPGQSEGIVGIRKVEYDAEDRELEIEFDQKVDYENLSVEVTDASGAAVDVRITDKDKDDIELKIAMLTRGESYTVRISGIGPKGSGTFGEVSTEFTAG